MTRPVILALLILSACGTAQDRCLRRNTEDLRTVVALIEETERDIARGYTYRTEVRDVSFGLGLCTGLGRNVGFCAENDLDTYDRPVTIDPEAERRKLAFLQERRAALAAEAAPKIDACRKQFPQGEVATGPRPMPTRATGRAGL